MDAQYPDFKGLIQMIEQRSGHRWRGENFDHYLGTLENAGIDVHRSAQKILTNPDSRPNSIHSDIMRLFRDSKSVRIVTTNFDDHFSTVAATVHGAITDFAAPALPVGNRFSGIVYVHGTVRDHADGLVLTDRDFGKAYSTEGWARRFLVDAFRKYTVLFINYSHNDPPMVYLTRGLTPEADRLFAISLDTEDAHWRHLGITPIPYKLRPGPLAHSAVQQGVQSWADYSAMRVLDHKARITQLLKHPPDSLIECDNSYLQRCFRTRQLLPLLWAFLHLSYAAVFNKRVNLTVDPKEHLRRALRLLRKDNSHLLYAALEIRLALERMTDLEVEMASQAAKRVLKISRQPATGDRPVIVFALDNTQCPQP